MNKQNISPAVESDVSFEASFPKVLLAQQWLNIPIRICCSDNCSHAIRLVDISHEQPELEIKRDLPKLPMLLHPGECLQTTITIQAVNPTHLHANEFFLAFDDAPLDANITDSTRITLPPAQLAFFPSPATEFDIHIEPLCSYGDKGIKTEITITHRGKHTFKDLRIHIEPTEQVVSCQSIHRTMFPKIAPPDQSPSANGTPGSASAAVITLEALLRPGDMELVFEYLALGRRAVVRLPHTLVEPEQNRYEMLQFLEPRRVSNDEVRIEQIREDGNRSVTPIRAAYPLYGGNKYKITIMPPRGDAVERITMRDIHGRLHVRSSNHNQQDMPDGERHKRWTFEVEITYRELLRRPDRLHYSVQGTDRPLNGEIFIVFIPPWYKHLMFGVAVGATATLQGVVALGRSMFTQDITLEEILSDLISGRKYQIWFLLCVPGFWLVIWAIDRVVYRLRS